MRNAFISGLFILLIGCVKSNSVPTTPTSPVVTLPNAPTDLKGILSSSTQIDLTWSDASNNEDGFKVERKSGTDAFSLIATLGQNVVTYSDKGLSAGTTYTYRIQSFNSKGNSTYSNEIVLATLATNITDIEGNKYNIITIGQQVWMAENLKTTKYQNGDNIPEIQPANLWNSQTSGAFVYYNNNSQNNSQYGKLYNWYASVDIRNVCPVNWHVPSNNDWNILSYNLGGSDSAGSKLKITGTTFWASPNIATNLSGFSAVANGCRCNDSGAFGGGPQPPNQGMGATFWTTSEPSTGSSLSILRGISNSSAKLDSATNFKYYGFGIRCVKN